MYDLESQNLTMANPTLNIFEQEENNKNFKDDFIDEIQKTKNCSIKFHLKAFSVKFSSGYHFPSEIYTFLDDDEMNNYTETYDHTNIGSIQGYETYHLKNLNPGLLFEIEKQKSPCKDHVLLRLTNLQLEFAKGNNFAFQLGIDDFCVEDNLAISRYKYIIAKESKSRLVNEKITSEQIFRVMYIQKNKEDNVPHICVNLMIYPIRLCVYGATFEYLYETYFLSSWKSQKCCYIEEKQQLLQKRLEQLDPAQSRQALIEIAHQEGYELMFGSLLTQRQLFVQQIIISSTKITLSYDGSGIQINQILKGMMRIAYQDNLEVKLK